MAERITLTISTATRAFDDEPATEIARILRQLAGRLEEGDFGDPHVLHDSQGNVVGNVRIEKVHDEGWKGGGT